MNGRGTELVDRDGTGMPAAIVPKVWPGGDGDVAGRADGGMGTGARRAVAPVASDRVVVVGEDGDLTTDRASPKGAGVRPVHRADAGDRVVMGEDGDVTADRASPKDAGEGPVHRPEAGAGRVSGPAWGEGGTTRPAMIGPEKRVVDSKFALWLEPAAGLASTRAMVPVAGDLGARGMYCRG